MIDAIVRGETDDVNVSGTIVGSANLLETPSSNRPKVLLVDHEDSFVHTLANYLRQSGADVVTCRSGDAFNEFLQQKVDSGVFIPDLAVLSPGPGSPSEFKLSRTIDEMIARKVPIFGVCLGLQGLVEHFGGELGILDYPMHGKPSPIQRKYDDAGLTFDILKGLPSEFTVARYHSLHGKMAKMPKDLIVTATTSDGIVMAIQHSSMPIAAVQFHPESILTLPKHGMRIILNALEQLKSQNF